MQFIVNYWSTGGSNKDIPYTLGDSYSSAWGSWSHHKGNSKENGDPVSVFSLNANNAQDARLAAGRNGAKRLRTVRHPNILSFLFSTEIEKEEGKPTLFLVTEPVMPLADKIKELNLQGTQRDEYFAWGVQQIAKALNFLNNDCKLIHGNVCVASVVVTPSLDWKLHALDVMADFEGANATTEGPLLQYDWLVGAQYKPLEVSKGDWAAVRKGPPHAIDSWGLGCLVQELFSGKPLGRTEDLRSTGLIPKTLLPDYQRLLGSQPHRRLNSAKLIDNSEFFQNKLVDTIHFMDVLNLKDSVEKDSFFRKLPVLAEQLPREIVVKKLLPQLSSALEFGSAPAAALNPLLKLGSWLPAEDFASKVIPTIVKLFGSTDRTVRISLLQHMEVFGDALSPAVVDEQVFNHVITGFVDSSAFLRELTLKSMLTLAPKLSHRNLSGALLKHLSKLQVDEEPAIRTNTTILLGNIARYLNDATRKRVLINAFTVRALRDTFPPARAAGIMALMATKEFYDTTEIGTRILPNLVVLTVDPDPDVRSKALQGSDTFLKAVKDHFEGAFVGEAQGANSSAPAPSSVSSSGILGWAVSSLTSSKPNPQASSSAVSVAPVQTISSSSSSSQLQSVATAIPSESPPANGWDEDDSLAKDPESQADQDDVADDDDEAGWGDLEEEETKAPLTRIQAAQQRPVAQQSRPVSVLKPSPQPLVTQAPVPVRPVLSAHREKKEEAEGDPWGTIAAPKPISSVKPLGLKSAASRPAASSKPSISKVGGHVSLPQTAEMSLEDLLTGSRPAGAGRGRGRGTISKLGAQRINK